MTDERVMEATIDTATMRAFDNPNSPESRAFFNGARAIMSALQEIPADQHPQVLAFKNRQHIMATLAMGESLRHSRKRQEAQMLLTRFPVDKNKFRAFIFDVPNINDDGIAVDKYGNPLEDENFNLLPGKTNPGWPECTIYNLYTDEEISLERYNQLPPEEKEKYGRYRTLNICTAANKPAMTIRSFDHELVEELIRMDIGIGDPVNNRYILKASPHDEDDEPSELHRYLMAIWEEMAVLSHSQRIGINAGNPPCAGVAHLHSAGPKPARTVEKTLIDIYVILGELLGYYKGLDQ